MTLSPAILRGGILGLLVGDALGVPYEFHRPEALPPAHALEFEPPADFVRAHHGVPPGTWSDDGAQALCLAASLLECGRFDADDFGRRLLRWYDDGYLAVDGVVFDIGVTTGAALRALRAGAPPLEAGPAGPYDNGNGALMRVLPLALWHRGDDRALVTDAHLQSRLTHGHARSQACCALYCLWARSTAAGVADPWRQAVASLRAIYGDAAPYREELEQAIRPDDDSPGRGSGYVVDCLRSARWAVGQGSYEQVVRAAVALGHDTDTTACVAGGIAGLRDGVGAIPQRWLTGLRGTELAEPLLEGLCSRS